MRLGCRKSPRLKDGEGLLLVLVSFFYCQLDTPANREPQLGIAFIGLAGGYVSGGALSLLLIDVGGTSTL